MPVTPTYPGVYIQEIPSGVHAITGVPTAIAAFVGRALKGPVDSAIVINSFSDFGRIFGGMAVGYPLGYSVRDFFANGGGQAIIVRIYNAGSSTSTTASAEIIPGTTTPSSPALRIEASSPGAWGNKLRVDYEKPTSIDPTVLANLGYSAGELFDLVITDTATGVSETIRYVSIKEGSRRVDRVLEAESQLVRVEPNSLGLPTVTLPSASSQVLFSTTPLGSDGVAITSFGAYFPSAGGKTGVNALDDADLFNLLCIPPDSTSDDWKATGPLFAVYRDALAYCKSRRAFLIVDPPKDWTAVGTVATSGPSALGLVPGGDYGAVYFPRLLEPDPLKQGQIGAFAPSGAVAGVLARTDNDRGVWKAPAGLNAGIVGAVGFDVKITDAENGQLNPLGVNCLRTFAAAGNVVWGARTLRGADALTDDYKYVPVRRLALFLEESLFRGTKWVVFEPNDEPLWSQIRLNIGAFMNDLFRKGAFAGKTPKDAYLVKCDAETTTPYDQSTGVVNIVVGFAPLRPAEFVILNIQQLAGQTA